jgi:hypothetical protein
VDITSSQKINKETENLNNNTSDGLNRHMEYSSFFFF